jgi:N-acyl-L-homoserine lactone synthetase
MEATEVSPTELEALDRACAQVLEAASQLEVEPASSAAQREACFRLRFHCVVEHGWAGPADFPDGMERDAYDELATHVGAWKGSELAGTVRLLFPQRGLLLPIEKEFGVELRPPSEVVDGGRLVVAPRYRGEAGHRVLAALFSRSWQLARTEGLCRFAALAPDGIIGLYRALGIRVKVLGEPRPFWGEERQPIMISGADPETLFSQARGDNVA